LVRKLDACRLKLDTCLLLSKYRSVMLGACRLTLVTWIMALLPLMVLKEPYGFFKARIRCTPGRRPSPYATANDLIQYSTREFFSVHRSKHLKLIYPSKLYSLCIGYPEEVPGMLHQLS